MFFRSSLSRSPLSVGSLKTNELFIREFISRLISMGQSLGVEYYLMCFKQQLISRVHRNYDGACLVARSIKQRECRTETGLRVQGLVQKSEKLPRTEVRKCREARYDDGNRAV